MANTAKHRAVRTPRAPQPSSKLDHIVKALRASKGATISQLMRVTGWQAHSVRGAMSGALKKQRGLTITSEKLNGARVYRIKP